MNKNKMLLIDNHNLTDPAVNLALEEYCYRHLDARRAYVLFYVNQPSIIIGNHQCPFQEIQMELAAQRQIRTIRRISGGGAVYHDSGNLNFSFITEFGEKKLDYFKLLLQPILDTLNRLGVPAQLTGKNNLVVANKKISGNSQHANVRRMLSHGTLLVHADLDTLQQVLRSNLEIIQSRAIASIPSSVTNISDHLPRPIEMSALVSELICGIAQQFGKLGRYQLTAAEWDAVHQLAEEKYRSWEWNIGRSPEFTVKHILRFGAGDFEVSLQVKNAIIEDLKSLGDPPDAALLSHKRDSLVGRRYDPLQLALPHIY